MTAPDIATPSPIRTPSAGPYSLSERINIATRPVHTTLNKLILARLPLALPPNTTNPSTYVSGLLHVAPIYINFESLWQSLIDAPPLPTSLRESFPFESPEASNLGLQPRTIPLLTPPDSPLPESPRVCPRTKGLLMHLRLSGLLRSQRLRNDIRALTGTPAHEIEQQLAVVSLKGRLGEFITHTKKSVELKPHVLLAYTWVLYMAMFSGGRYLRASLKEAGGIGPNFWERDPSPIRPYSITRSNTCGRGSKFGDIEGQDNGNTLRFSARSRSRSDNDATTLVPGMEFFNFPGDSDGEDIKTLFKARITEAEVLLTAGEKEDIITEAQHIFDFMISLVDHLDTVMGAKPQNSSLQPPRPPLAARDSIDLAQERIERAKIDSFHEKLDAPKPTFLEAIILSRVRYLRTLVPVEALLRPFSRRASEEGPATCPQVSFSRADEQIPCSEDELHHSQNRVLRFLFSFTAFLVVLVAWFLVAQR